MLVNLISIRGFLISKSLRYLSRDASKLICWLNFRELKNVDDKSLHRKAEAHKIVLPLVRLLSKKTHIQRSAFMQSMSSTFEKLLRVEDRSHNKYSYYR